MSEPKAFRWHYDRTPREDVPEWDTFSVGVYQWLPKASGKGLKKSKTIRIKGYGAEPDRVYQKASELCRTLNEQGVRIENPPSWLQKQYSVPRPTGYVKERATDDSPVTIDAKTLRSVRTRVLKRILEPAGFRRHGSLYVRQHEHQIQGVDFQAHKFGGKFMVNLAFHFDFVPSCFTLATKEAASFTLLDFCLRKRLGVDTDYYTTAYEYPQDRDACDDLFRELGSRILNEVTTCAEQHANPASLVELLDPATLHACHDWLDADNHDDDRDCGVDEDALRKLMVWFEDGYAPYLLLGHCALELGDRPLAAEYGRMGMECYADYQPARSKKTPRQHNVPIANTGGVLIIDLPIVVNSRESILKAMDRLASDS